MQTEKQDFLQYIRTSLRVSAFVKEKSDEEILDYYEFQKNGYLTNLGVLWIGQRQDRSSLLHAPIIQVIRFNDMEEKGIDRLSGFVTEELQKQGHDGIVFNGDGEHEIVVFDKNNVRDKNVTQAETKSNTVVKPKQRTKRTKSSTPFQKRLDVITNNIEYL